MARALTRQGFPRVYAINGGFSGWGGWVDSKLAVTPAVSVRQNVVALPSFAALPGGTVRSPVGGIRYLGGAPSAELRPPARAHRRRAAARARAHGCAALCAVAGPGTPAAEHRL